MSLIWIPNLLSLLNLFFGFTSILAALRGRFDLAVVLIFAATIMDMFDGRIARMIKKDNPLGKELDSFADLVSFGVAPGIIFYAAFLGQGPLYDLWANPGAASNLVHFLVGMAAFIFPIFAALRLAKFNTMEAGDSFIGLPSPVAGGAVVLLIGFHKIPGFFLDGFLKALNFTKPVPYQLMIPLFLIIGLFMVLPIPFGKPQRVFLNFTNLRSPMIIILNLLIIAALILFFKFFLLLVIAVYIISAVISSRRKTVKNDS